MNRTWLIIEKVIAVIIIVWGMVALYSVTMKILEMRSGFAPAGRAGYLLVISVHHLNFLLALASMFAGAFLLFNDKDGWLLSIICSFIYMVSFFISSRMNSQHSNQPFYQFYKSYSAMTLLFLAIFILLLLKPFIRKYQPSARNWLTVAGIIAILLIDKAMF